MTVASYEKTKIHTNNLFSSDTGTTDNLQYKIPHKTVDTNIRTSSHWFVKKEQYGITWTKSEQIYMSEIKTNLYNIDYTIGINMKIHYT